MSKRLIIAIDGPAGSGKSTSAKLVAQKLDYLYIDTGAMYRAITFLAIKQNVLNNPDAVINLAENTDIQLSFVDGTTEVYAANMNITEEIRSKEVNANVSDVSKIEEVRTALVRKQRQMGLKSGGVVMEGRDIGTVVFPEADVKIFLTANINERAVRRAKEFKEKGVQVTTEEIKKSLELRDKIDSSREISPLIKAPDAVTVDTSKVTIEEQVDIILDRIKETAVRKNIVVNI